MNDKKHLIILLLNSHVDRRLISEFLMENNFLVEHVIPTTHEKIFAVSMIIVDEVNAKIYLHDLLKIKQRVGILFLPLIILLPVKINAMFWLESGFNEVLKMPLVKHELLTRIKSLIQLREYSENQYQFIFQNINIGIYKLDKNLRIIMSNEMFRKQLGLPIETPILNLTLHELGIITENTREALFKGVNSTNRYLKCESKWIFNNKEYYFLENIHLEENKNISSYVCTLEDVTQRKFNEIAMSSNEEKYRQLIESSPFGLIIIQDGIIKFANSAFLQMIKASHAPNIINKPLMKIIHPDFHEIVSKRIIRAQFSNFMNEKLQERLICIDDSVIDVEVISCRINYNGRAGVQATINDITEHLKDKRIIDHMAYYDPLTNIANRAKFEKIVKADLQIAEKHNSSVVIMFLDLDHFKNINDTLGHRIGDLMLVEVANRLANCVSQFDTVARLGGDEFVVELVSHDNSLFNVKDSVNKIIKALTQPYTIDNHVLNITTSIGISIFPNDGKDLTSLFKNADIAMYSAKQKGRNNFQFCTPQLTNLIDEKVKLEKELRLAIANNELFLCFQPKLCLKTTKIIGVEALLRWTHPTLGIIPPSKFISIAEEGGLIFKITELVFLLCCKQIKEWEKNNFKTNIAVNLSVKNFQQNLLLPTILNAINTYNVDPSNFEIEITESVIMEDVIKTQQVLTQLKQVGFTISMDDFGTGYSSLSYLRRFEIDTLKIDASFIRDILDDPNDAAIVIAIIAMAHSLKLKVIAEGVENQEQIQFLEKYGCDQIQGFYLCPPLISTDLVKFVSSYSFVQNNL